MTIADEMGFETNGKENAESIIGSISNINPSSWIAKNGDNVQLRHKTQNIQVKNVEIKQDNSLEGEIFDFTNLSSIEYAGLKLNQRIGFTNKHVFHITKNTL